MQKLMRTISMVLVGMLMVSLLSGLTFSEKTYAASNNQKYSDEVEKLRKEHGEALDEFLDGLEEFTENGVIDEESVVKLFVKSAKSYWVLGESLSLAGKTSNVIKDIDNRWYKNLYKNHCEIVAMIASTISNGGYYTADSLNSLTTSFKNSKAELRADVENNKKKLISFFNSKKYTELLNRIDAIDVDYKKGHGCG